MALLCSLTGALVLASTAFATPPETPETKTPTSITSSSAVFHGVLNPGAAPQADTYEFLYRKSASECQGESATPPAVTLGLAKEAVAEPVGTLEANTEYTVCLQARNIAEELSALAPVTFKTLAAPPMIVSETLAFLKAHEARLEAVVDPENGSSECHFQYGQASVGEHEAECEQGTVNGREQGVGMTVSSLEQHKPYKWRVIIKNGAGEAKGEEKTFTTALPPESPEGLRAEPLASFSATLKGVLNPKAPGDPGSYEFRLRQSPSECEGEGERRLPEPPALASGAEGELAQAEVTGLLPHTAYAFCLRASNSATPEAETTASAPATFTTPAAAPQVEDSTVSNVAATSATLSATLNPEGAPSTYAFEYAPAGGAFTPVLELEGKGSLPEAVSGVALSVHVHQGLSPNASYEFRLVAKNAASPQAVVGEAVSFTTQVPGGELVLPDGRQWEMVTPPDKHGALFFGLNQGVGSFADPFVAQASANGDAIVDLATQPTEQLIGNTNEISILSTRSPAGWSSQVIAPPHAHGTGPPIGQGGEYRLFSEDLSLGAVQQFGNFAPLSPDASESTPYLHSDYLNANVSEHCQSSCFQALVTRANTQEGAVFGEVVAGNCEHFICGPRFLDATSDLSHVILGTPIQLTSTANAASEFGERFYEWGGGQLQPLYLLPKSEGAIGVSAGEPSSLNQTELAYHQLSEDGSLFFTYHGHVYLHDFAKGESVRLDGEEPGEGEATFLYASSDGSRVLFTDPKQLTKAPGGGVYECRIKELSCELELTGLSGRGYSIEGEHLAVGSLLGGSRDASYVYFMGAGERLIVAHFEGGRWTTSEGPVIPETQGSGFVPFCGLALPPTGCGSPATYRISPNGRFIAFMSNRKLTAYDNRDALSGQPDEEVYLYEAASNRLACASCNPTGARPVGAESGLFALVGGEFADSNVWVASNVPPWERSTGLAENSELYQPRYLSDSGRLFFDSHDALVPQDVNGTQDVYEYEPVGVPEGENACSVQSATFSARSGGCVNLISLGDSSEESAFLDASQSGSDVFFLTSSKLSPQDYDTALDVYDAHECTSASPCIAPPPPPGKPCDTEASCKASPTPQPNVFGTPASGTFSGPGNVSPPPAPTLKVKTAAQIRAEKLAKALKACHAKHNRRQRATCERLARKHYGPVKKASKAKRADRRRRRAK